jgi:hypothetical protein
MSPRYRRVAGVTERRVGASLFLANPQRGTVYRVNDTVAALWNLLATPATQEEAIATFHQAFPDADPDELATNVHTMLVDLLDEGLLEPLS